ncbi:MAG: hypothetical protein Q8Q09_27965 [Deltaproteobacteria bacterium]|nr:hypothetical protein [Deltaproteobacteria bacterium]
MTDHALSLRAARFCTIGGLLLAAAACSPPMPTTDASGNDGSMTPDVTGTDTMGSEAGGAQCNRVAIEDLNMLGMVAGDTLRYTGNNNMANEMPGVGAQTSAAIQGLNGCAFRTAYQRVFAYRATTNTVLRISTTNAATTPGFDTTLLVYSMPCPATATNQARALLACNDDDQSFDGDDRRITSSVVTLRKVMAGSTVYISVGGFVPVMGARNTEGERGTFELSVQELSLVAANGMCDPRRLTNACDDAFTCVGDTLTSPTGRCVADGTAAGAGCNAGACTAPLMCDPETSRCQTVNVPNGMPCDPFRICGTTSSCVSLQRGSTLGVCRAGGSVVGSRCGTGVTCAAGLTCVTPMGAADGICLRAAPMGGMCSTYDSSCPMGEDCVSASVLGTAGTCRALGSAAGADCAAGMCSGAGLTCGTRGTSMVCVGTRMTGQTCGVFDECSMNGTCYLNEPNNRTQGMCFAAGGRGGPCRAAAPNCDTGLTCSDTTMPADGRCIAMAAAGGMCDFVTQCADTQTCVRTSAVGMPFAGTCRAQGAEGARCRGGAMSCDTGLTCSSGATADGICQRAATGACDALLATNRCPMGQVCRATSLSMGMCTAPTMEREPNDLVASTLMPVTAPAAIAGSLSLADVDCYALTVPAMGRVFARATAPSGLCPADLALDLYRLEGTDVRLMGTDTDSGSYGCPRIDGADTTSNFSWASGLAAGTYYVCLRNNADTRAPVSAYALSLNATAP